MAWNDDSWKDGYDAWKLRSPYDDEPEEECEHENYDIDWRGRAHCDDCNEAWWASESDIAHFRCLNVAFDAHMRREERRQWWRDQWERVHRPWRWFWYELFTKLGMHRRAVRSLSIHDEVPF
jgi:hypothetical protein